MNHQLWDSYRGKIKTKKGGWRIGKGVSSHGYDLLNDVVGHYSYMQVVILNATGRMPSRELADWVEAVYICLSWPDPRIWCNRIGALGGTVNASAISATCAGIMANDSRSYGARPMLEGVKLIQEAKKRITLGERLEDFVMSKIKESGGLPFLMGYARPVAKGDERVATVERVTKSLGFVEGGHLALAYKIEKFLHDSYGESMNINGYASGFLADQGFSPDEVYRMCTIVVSSGITACYADSADRKQGMFSPLKVRDVLYIGIRDRKLPL